MNCGGWSTALCNMIEAASVAVATDAASIINTLYVWFTNHTECYWHRLLLPFP